MDKFLTRFTLGLLVACAVLLIAVLVYSATVPFQPYTLKSYEIRPEQQCMGDVVMIYPTRILQPGDFDIYIDPYWAGVSTEGIIEEPKSTSLDIQGTGEMETVQSPLLQAVPEEPGLWQHNMTIIVDGKIGVLDRKEHITAQAENVVKVLPNSSDKCNG